MPDVLLKCGHRAQAIDDKGNPSCVICWPSPEAKIVDETPNLEGRRARCSYFKSCGSEKDSSLSLPFFNYLGPGSRWSREKCKHCWYFKMAHTNEAERPITDHEFEPAGPAEFDDYYCGCHGWD